MKPGVCQSLRGTTCLEVGYEPDQPGSFNSQPTGLDDGILQITGTYRQSINFQNSTKDTMSNAYTLFLQKFIILKGEGIKCWAKVKIWREESP